MTTRILSFWVVKPITSGCDATPGRLVRGSVLPSCFELNFSMLRNRLRRSRRGQGRAADVAQGVFWRLFGSAGPPVHLGSGVAITRHNIYSRKQNCVLPQGRGSVLNGWILGGLGRLRLARAPGAILCAGDPAGTDVSADAGPGRCGEQRYPNRHWGSVAIRAGAPAHRGCGRACQLPARRGSVGRSGDRPGVRDRWVRGDAWSASSVS